MMFHAQKVIVKPSSASTRFLVWPVCRELSLAAVLVTKLSSPSQASGVRSRVPTGAQPRCVGAAPGAGRSSRLR